MRAAAAISEHPLAAHAVGEVAGSILEQLDSPIDVLFLFVEASHTGAIEDIVSALHELLRPAVLVGSTACGVIGQTVEVEDRGAVSVWAGTGLDAKGFRVEPGHTEPTDGWQGLPGTHVVSLLDPFSCAAVELVDHAALERTDLRFSGGFASAANGPGGNRLVLDDRIFSDGAVGASLSGPTMRSVVSQGCRPVGSPLVVTAVDGHVITELGSQPPMDRLRSVAESASSEVKALLADGIHIGVVMDETLHDFSRGDFLIRGVLGADAESGAIAIGAEVPVGTTVQFQVRDAETAAEDLQLMLTDVDAVAALTFTCNGRGKRLFGRSGCDAERVHGLTGSEATAGMFCAGELGPVAGINHLHGFTASSLLFVD